MIRAADALKLPTAALTDSENEIVGRYMAEIEKTVREKMKYDGITIDITGLPRYIAVAMTHQFEKDGWTAVWTPYEREAKFSRNIMQTGFILQLAPSEAAYAEAGLKKAAGLH